MRRDAWTHPRPEMFDKWAEGGICPYDGSVERMHFFEEKREYWVAGPPKLADRELIVEICNYKKWKIKK